MPSFDIVSEVDAHELTNAIDQANREVQTRFDFKGTNAKFEQDGERIVLHAQNTFQLEQMLLVLQLKCSKRQIEQGCLDVQAAQENLNEAKQAIVVKQGIATDLAKKIVKTIKDSKLKVQAAIQGEQIRVTGKKRDDLQETISLLNDKKFELPLQFNNFRD